MKNLTSIFTILSLALIFIRCTDHTEPYPEPQKFTATNFVNGLRSPIGMSLDEKGQIWVTEAGTGKNDGSVVMITPEGKKTTFVSGFPSVKANNSVEGLSHLLYKNGKLYILHGVSGFLYTADVSGFKSGDPEKVLANIEKEDIGTYIRDQKLTEPLNSNGYDLTFGPDGHLYIVDAGSNAIFRRNKADGNLSLFAEIPRPVDTVDAVPTGIVFDGSQFLVSTLTGFPFTSGHARIFKVTTEGAVSAYDTEFTLLTNIALSANNKPLVVQFAQFGMGFTPSSGKILDVHGNVLLDNLMMPTDIKHKGGKDYYLLSYALGTIQKLTY